MGKSFILTYKTLDEKNISFDELTQSENDKIVTSKIWYTYSKSEVPKTLFYQTSKLKIYDVAKSGDLIVTIDQCDINVFDKIDDKTIDFIKTQNLTKKYNIKNVNYRQITREFEKDKRIVLPIRISGNDTLKYYVGDNKIVKQHNDIRNNLSKDKTIKIIFEIESVNIDTKNSSIMINMIPKQMLIYMVPQKIILSDYSFVESDDDTNDDTNDDIVNPVRHDTIINDDSDSESSDDFDTVIDKISEDSDDSCDVANFVNAFNNKKNN